MRPRFAPPVLVALLALALSTPVLAQEGVGPQVVVDHNSRESGLGTNPGVGLRFSGLLGLHSSGFASLTAFYDIGRHGNSPASTYFEGEGAFLFSPRGFDQGLSPYVGAGAALLSDSGRDVGASAVVIAGAHFMVSHSSVPFLELQYFTRGHRVCAVAGVYLWQ